MSSDWVCVAAACPSPSSGLYWGRRQALAAPHPPPPTVTSKALWDGREATVLVTAAWTLTRLYAGA